MWACMHLVCAWVWVCSCSGVHDRDCLGLFNQGSHMQGVYNRLLLVPIVGCACFLRHQLAAVFNA